MLADSKYQNDPTIKRISQALNPLEIRDNADLVKIEGQRRASVLIPLIPRETGWQVLLTQRPDTMPSHAGQISFPGGRVNEGERAKTAALRETEEEVGLKPQSIELLGRLDSFNAGEKYRVTPFVGIVDPSAPIIPCPREVAEAFEVPLDHFMNADNHQSRDIEYKDKKIKLWDMPYDEPNGTNRHVWGMTAMTLYRLYRRAYHGDFTHPDA